MCNCLTWKPLSFSIIKFGDPKLNRSQIPGTHFPIITNNGRLQVIGCSMKATPSPSSGLEGEGYGHLEFEDNELELERRRGDASLEKISDKSGDKLVSNRRQLMKRSNMVAKQVISIQSAQSLGFVSQLWVDTTSWLVLVMEVRPSLIAGESERFLLQDVKKVGDVVLVEDERLMNSDFKRVRLETLVGHVPNLYLLPLFGVGYRVVTPRYQNIGKVRGYTFNINSGTVESLELDSFGISIIPSSLVSTYALLIEDVLEVIADTVVIHEAAASGIQRLTKGFWDAPNSDMSMDEFTEFGDDEVPGRSDGGRRTRRRSSGSHKSRSKIREEGDDWELPMDYL